MLDKKTNAKIKIGHNNSNSYTDSCDKEIENLFNLTYSKYYEDTCSIDSMNDDLVVHFQKKFCLEHQQDQKSFMLSTNNHKRPNLNFKKMRQVRNIVFK